MPELSSKKKTHSGLNIKNAINIFIATAGAVYIGLVILISNSSSILDSVGLTPFVEWVAYEWQRDLYSELLRVADFGIPLLIFQIMIVTYLFYAIYILVFIGFLLKYKDQYLASLELIDAKFLPPFDTWIFRYSVYLSSLGYAYMFITFPKQMVKGLDSLPPDLSSIIIFAIMGLGLVVVWPVLIHKIVKKWALPR